MKKYSVLFFIILLILVGCQPKPEPQATIQTEDWGEVDGKPVKYFTLTNGNGMILKVTNMGAAMTNISVPDKDGNIENVVIGFETLEEKIKDKSHGKTIGRFANRIGGAQFTLYGETYKLTANKGTNTLHGGEKGFASQVFDIDSVFTNADSAVVSLHYYSPDLEEGFPGNLTLYLDYVLTGDNEIKLNYKAVTDKPTVVNFTNHVYFNLTGKGDTIMDNQVQIFADLITAMGEDGLPTGEIVSVAGTMYDYTTASSLIDKLDPGERGYDINYVLRNNASEPVLAAVVVDRESGRKLEAYTTEPGMQLFTRPNSICLEMQHYPDSPNHPNFPSVVLNPGEIYHQLTVYKFSAVQE